MRIFVQDSQNNAENPQQKFSVRGNDGRFKTDQPIKRSNGIPRFVKLVENNG